MYTHVYIRGRKRKINREGLFVAGRKCAKYLRSKLLLQRTGITRMQFLIGFDRLLRTGSISTRAVTMFRDRSQKA